jgi:hypothetical protein
MGEVRLHVKGVKWTKEGNVFEMECRCGKEFEGRMDRWHVQCPSCSRRVSIHFIRRAYLERQANPSFASESPRTKGGD